MWERLPSLAWIPTRSVSRSRLTLNLRGFENLLPCSISERVITEVEKYGKPS